MKIIILRCSMIILVGAVSFAFAGPCAAATVNLKAELKASNEVPPNDSKSSGSVTLTFDEATKKLTWKGSYANLTGPVTAAHFHGPGPAGKNASVVFPIFAAPAVSGPLEGSATLTDEQANQLLTDQWYVNLHSAAHQAGEIRGQVTK
jgi:CHRD domain